MNRDSQNRIWIVARPGVLVLCLALSLTSCRKGGASKEESNLFAGDAAQKAAQKIAAEIPSGPHVFSIEIRPNEMIVIVQSSGAPDHLDAYRHFTVGRGLLSFSGVTGPRPAEPVIINPDLEENLFDLAEVNLAAVAETAREAARRLALEGGGAVTSIRIQRQVSIVPEPHSGAIQWYVSVRGPRESASATADAQGRILRIDLSGTRRAQTVDFTKGGEALAAAVETIREQFGSERIFKKITISRTNLAITVRDPNDPKSTVGFGCDLNGLRESREFMSADLRKLTQGELRESELFSVDDADWARVPAVAKAALEKVPIPGGRVFSVALMRRYHPLEEYPADWQVHVTSAAMFGDNGHAFFDARSGELTELKLPDSLIKPVAYLEPENTRRLLTTILEDFPPETRFSGLAIEQDSALVTATRAKHPNDLRRYSYSATERAKLNEYPPVPLHDSMARDAIFTAAEVASFVPRLDALRTSAFKRLGMKDGQLQSMAFWRKHRAHSPSKNLVLELRCISPTLGHGYIVYELSGKEFYVALP